MRSLCLTISRICAAAVFGAGVMFVVEVIGLRGSTLFEEPTKLNHARVLFPLYYQVEFLTLSTAIIFGLLGRPSGWRGPTYLLLLVAGWMILAADHEWVYKPLAAMLSAPARPETFTNLHQLSRLTNGAVLACSLAAAFVGTWPPVTSDQRPQPTGQDPVALPASET